MVTKKEVLESLKEEIEFSAKYFIDPVCEYSKELFNTNKINNPIDYPSFDIWTWFTITFYNNLKLEDEVLRKKSVIVTMRPEDNPQGRIMKLFEYSKESTEKIKPLIDILSASQIAQLMISILKNPNRVRRLARKMSKVVISHNSLEEIFGEDMSELFNQDPERIKQAILDFVDMVDEHEITTSDSIKVVVRHKMICEILAKMASESNDFSKLLNSRKSRNKVDNLRGFIVAFLKDIAQLDYDEEIVEPYRFVQSKCNEIMSHVNEFAKKSEKKKRLLAKIYELVSSTPDNVEIINARDMVKGLDEESSLKKLILNWINDHNQRLYSVLTTKYQELSKNNIIQYRAILIKYMLNVCNSEIFIISQNLSPENVEIIIKSLRRKNISDEDILTILKNTTVDVFSRVEEYISQGYFNSDFVRSNLDIYNPKSKKLSKYEEIVEFLKKHQVNPRLFCNCPHILFNDYSKVTSNILLLEDYGLITSLKTSEDLSFVLKPNLAELIDLFIELGLVEVLQNNIRLLNYSKREIKRLKLLYMINGYTFFDEEKNPLLDWDDLFELVESKNFFMDDDQIDDCFADPINYDSETVLSKSIDDLKRDFIDQRITIIGNSIFSTKKIERKLKEGLPMFDAIFFNKVCSDEEYDRIMCELSPSQK